MHTSRGNLGLVEGSRSSFRQTHFLNGLNNINQIYKTMRLAKSNEIVSGKEFIFVTKDVMSGELRCYCQCKPYDIHIKDGYIRWSTTDSTFIHEYEIPYNDEPINRIVLLHANLKCPFLYDVTVYRVD